MVIVAGFPKLLRKFIESFVVDVSGLSTQTPAIALHAATFVPDIELSCKEISRDLVDGHWCLAFWLGEINSQGIINLHHETSISTDDQDCRYLLCTEQQQVVKLERAERGSLLVNVSVE